MEITSAGLLSEFIFHRVNAEISDLGDCIMVRTPSNPAYFYGNTLIFPNPPKSGDAARWIARFDTVFTDRDVRHHTFQWPPGTDVPLTEFSDAGFTVEQILVLTARAVHSEKPAPNGVDFRPIKSDQDWSAVVDAQTEQGFASIPMNEYRAFKEAAFASYRAMSDRGLGDWWGAFKGETLVADLGLFFGDGIGRFQSVETAPAHQRQGICRAFINHVSNVALSERPDITLMLQADAGEVAEGIYRSVGFEQVEVLQSVFRAPKE